MRYLLRIVWLHQLVVLLISVAVALFSADVHAFPLAGISLNAEWDGKTKPPADVSGAEQYEIDEDTAKLKHDFETEWMRHVVSYTNHTTVGINEAYWDMQDFIKKWKPRVIRNQLHKESDAKVRKQMEKWMVKEKSIEGLYYGMLVPHREMMDRRAAYERIANSSAVIDGVELKFKNGRARWMSREFENCEMTAMMIPNLVWPRGKNDTYVFIDTDISANFDNNGLSSDSLKNYWLLRFSGMRCVWARKFPYKDVEMWPSVPEAPFGRRYTLVFRSGKASVADCFSGVVVLSVDE